MNEYVINLSYDRDSLLSELRRALNCLNQSFKNSKNEPALIIENKHNIQVIKSILTCVSSHIFQTEVEEYDGIFVAEGNGNPSMFLIGFGQGASDFRFAMEVVDWHYLDKKHNHDAHAKHEASETAEEEKAEHEYDVYDNKRMLENQNYNFGRYILILDSIDYDILFEFQSISKLNFQLSNILQSMKNDSVN
jgi:hypothetical protein